MEIKKIVLTTTIVQDTSIHQLNLTVAALNNLTQLHPSNFALNDFQVIYSQNHTIWYERLVYLALVYHCYLLLYNINSSLFVSLCTVTAAWKNSKYHLIKLPSRLSFSSVSLYAYDTIRDTQKTYLTLVSAPTCFVQTKIDTCRRFYVFSLRWRHLQVLNRQAREFSGVSRRMKTPSPTKMDSHSELMYWFTFVSTISLVEKELR